MMRTLILAITLFITAPTYAQTPSEMGAAADVDPARLAASKTLLEVILPPATREATMDRMMSSMMANLSSTMSAKLSEMGSAKNKPEVAAVIDRFIKRQQDAGMVMLKQNLPGMFDAMANAYARRFSVDQLNEIQRFFSTPTGKVYLQESMYIMSDPDVAAWQSKLMNSAMDRIPAEVDAMTKELKAVTEKSK